MSLQEILTYSLTLLGVAGGWWLRTIWGEQVKLRECLNNLAQALPKTYVLRDDFRDLAQEIKSTLVRIEEKLDGKADKP